MSKIYLPLMALIMLSACVTPTKVIKPLSDKDQGSRNINFVKVTYSELSAQQLVALDRKMASKANASDMQKSPLKHVLAKIVKDHLEARDNQSGANANIEIEVDNLKLIDPVAAVLIGDSDQLAGTVRVKDERTNEVLTEFYVDVLKGTGGLLGLAIRGGGVREKLSTNFADYIGDQMGFKELAGSSTYSTNSDDK